MAEGSISAGQHHQARKSGYLPTLDGWRALSILAVVLHHSTLLRLGPLSTSWFFLHGDFGVEIFFAISGLLICTRLLEEEARTGKLHLPGFYVRRVFRIQPASLTFLVVVLLMKLGNRVPLSWEGWIAAVTLVRNYLPANASGGTDFATLHFWSLSVEEHFYLFLPAFLAYVHRGRARKLLLASTGFVLWSACAARYGLVGTQAYHRTDLIMQQLLFPASVAVLLRRAVVRELLERILVPAVGITIALAIMLPIWLQRPFALRSLALIAPTCLVLSTMLHPESLTGRLLEWRPLRFVGKISFGLYLWQELFFTGHFAPLLRPLGYSGSFLVNASATCILAVLSYYMIERPCMRLGHRIAKPAVEGRPELS